MHIFFQSEKKINNHNSNGNVNIKPSLMKIEPTTIDFTVRRCFISRRPRLSFFYLHTVSRSYQGRHREPGNLTKDTSFPITSLPKRGINKHIKYFDPPNGNRTQNRNAYSRTLVLLRNFGLRYL